MFISAEQIQPILEKYESGRYLQAWQASLELAPLAEWEGTEAKVLAGRMCYVLGSRELAQRHFLRAWRLDRENARAKYFYARTLFEKRGALGAWHFLKQNGELQHAEPAILASWYGLQAAVFGYLRDFEEAEKWQARAEQTDPSDAYVWVDRAGLMMMEDRYDEALEAGRHSLVLRPWYHPAVGTVAELLILLDRESEALELLQEASTILESALIFSQLAQLQTDLQMYDEARANWDRCAEFSPLLDEAGQKWLCGRRADAAYHCGDYATSQELSNQAGSYFYRKVSRSLQNASADAGHRLLPVAFIRQHHMTCAPATLSMLSRYWQKPAEHLSVAERICYGGTSDYSERKWALENGYVAREFSVNQSDAAALIERGVPFTLATVDPGNAHLQSVIGYDQRRGTLLVRDPYVSSLGEFLGDGLARHYRSTGPRGMVIVPEDQAALLDGIELNEAELYDRLYAIQAALERHDRDTAEQVWNELQQAYPEHRLTHWARLVIAWYDDDQTQILTCVEKLLEQFPEDANLKMSKAYSLRALARRNERLEWLAELCRLHRKHEDSEIKDGEDETDEQHSKDPSRFFDPLFWQQYAEELSDDALSHPRAIRLLLRVLRYRPNDCHSIFLLANILWSQRRFDEACDLYRFCACLKDTDERYVKAYFTAARHLRKTQIALKMLEDRFNRFGRKSGAPARTFSQALEQVDEGARALQIMDEGLQLRPEDGDLILDAADVYARHGNFDRAESLLNQAEGRASRTGRLRCAATIAAYKGELPTALQLWRNVLDTEPLASDANSQVARLLAETEGQEQAVTFLREATARFPHSLYLHKLLEEWLRDQPEQAVDVIHHIIEIDPLDAWARRELAFLQVQLQNYDEAIMSAGIACQLEPQNSYNHSVMGSVLAAAGDIPAARAALEDAIKLSVDNGYAIRELIALAHSAAERREVFAFIQSELKQQVTYGDGLLAYQEQAAGTLDGEEVLELLQEALAARPDLALAWSAVIEQLAGLERLDEALQVAQEATARFPLIPRLWLTTAQVYQARLNPAGEIEALQQALRINPSWGLASQQLADAYERNGDRTRAREVLEQACALTPLDHFNHGCLADLLWRAGEKEKALERVQHAIKLDPGYDWGWSALRDWSQELKRPEEAVECARALTRQRPGLAHSWLTLARMITDKRALNDRLAAIDEALRIRPRSVDAHRFRIQLLAEARRFDEARSACRPPVFGENVPADLLIMAANVEAERGEFPEALRLLRELVKDEPNYFLAWYQLADWCSITGENRAYLEAAEAMTRLSPYNSVALGHLAAAKLLNDDRNGAKETLRRVLQLYPNYVYAIGTLFELQLEDREFSEAAETVKLMRLNIGDDRTTLCELKLALAQEDFDIARQSFRELCLSDGNDRLLLDEAVAYTDAERWQQIVDEELLYFQADVNAGVLWVERCIGRGEWQLCREYLENFQERDEYWLKVSIAYLHELVKSGRNSLFRQYFMDHKTDLKRTDESWGMIGYMLLQVGDVKEVINWLSDWRQRDKVEQWMMWNLVLALRQSRRESEAYEVGLRALELPPDHTTDPHNVFLAYDDLLRGDYDAGSQRLAHVNVGALGDWERALYDFVTALQDADHQRSKYQISHWTIADRLFSICAEKKWIAGDPVLLPVLKCIQWYIAEQSNNIALKLWIAVRLAFVSAFLKTINRQL